MSCELRGKKISEIRGRILTSLSMTAKNTFDSPNAVKPAPFDDVQIDADGMSLVLPPRSVVVLGIE